MRPRLTGCHAPSGSRRGLRFGWCRAQQRVLDIGRIVLVRVWHKGSPGEGRFWRGRTDRVLKTTQFGFVYGSRGSREGKTVPLILVAQAFQPVIPGTLRTQAGKPVPQEDTKCFNPNRSARSAIRLNYFTTHARREIRQTVPNVWAVPHCFANVTPFQVSIGIIRPCLPRRRADRGSRMPPRADRIRPRRTTATGTREPPTSSRPARRRARPRRSPRTRGRAAWCA